MVCLKPKIKVNYGINNRLGACAKLLLNYSCISICIEKEKSCNKNTARWHNGMLPLIVPFMSITYFLCVLFTSYFIWSWYLPTLWTMWMVFFFFFEHGCLFQILSFTSDSHPPLSTVFGFSCFSLLSGRPCNTAWGYSSGVLVLAPTQTKPGKAPLRVGGGSPACCRVPSSPDSPGAPAAGQTQRRSRNRDPRCSRRWRCFLVNLPDVSWFYAQSLLSGMNVKREE